MTRLQHPSHPLPEPLRGSDPGSFAHHTVTARLPRIARQTLADNSSSPAVTAALDALIRELPYGPVRPLTDGAAPDSADWAGYVVPYLGQDWLQVPWFFAETYFYRRILEATGYFQPGPSQHVDPFAQEKRRGLEATQAAAHALSVRLSDQLGQGDRVQAALADLLTVDLWGNQADLSLWSAGDEARPDHLHSQQADTHILVNDAEVVTAHLAGLDRRRARVDFLVDNAGFELVGDLSLADFLLTVGVVGEVHLHLKAHPTFVSDATVADVRWTVAHLSADSHPHTHALGRRLQDHLDGGHLRLHRHPFWTSPLGMWEMPPDLHRELGRSHLVISKGDANYRRLLGDRHWPFTTPLGEIVTYFPAPLVALRTLKSEVGAGLRTDQIGRLSREDPGWLVNGRWGVIQFVLCIEADITAWTSETMATQR